MSELEYVLKKIIEIDSKATDLQNKTEQTVEEEKNSLNKKIKSIDEKLSTDSEAELEKEVNAKIADAKDTATSISADSKEQCQMMREKYLRVKDKLKEQITGEIVEIS